MRFTDNLLLDRCIVNEVFHPASRQNVFARDIVVYMFRIRGHRWCPLPFQTYTIHRFSPLTPDIREAIDLVMRNNGKDLEYELRYQRLMSSAGDEKLLAFLHHTRLVLDSFFSGEESSVNEFFDVLCYVARLAVLFHEHGSFDAPHFAIVLLCEALRRNRRDIYHFLNLHAQNIIDVKLADSVS